MSSPERTPIVAQKMLVSLVSSAIPVALTRRPFSYL